jgi:hypothetical protein
MHLLAHGLTSINGGFPVLASGVGSAAAQGGSRHSSEVA